jgi:hypothetical protein
MHNTINTKDWKLIIENYNSEYIEGLSGRFLLRKERFADMQKLLNDITKAYKKAQHQQSKWESMFWSPLLEEIQSLAVDNKVILHAKPDTGNSMWWQYTYEKSPDPYGWGYSFSWISEPKEKINENLGQKLYDLDKYKQKFNNRHYMLSKILEKYLLDYLYELHDNDFIDKHRFSNKLVKFTLLGDEYWFRIGCRRGVPAWENFIWQSNKTIIYDL